MARKQRSKSSTESKTRKGLNPVVAGITGAAIGAAAGVTAAALSNKNTRKKIGTKLRSLLQRRGKGSKRTTKK
jgi:gas vesicle protein